MGMISTSNGVGKMGMVLLDSAGSFEGLNNTRSTLNAGVDSSSQDIYGWLMDSDSEGEEGGAIEWSGQVERSAIWSVLKTQASTRLLAA
jgi:hypothetical protein